MGKKDDYQYDYLDNHVRFADQVNGALFGGRQVVKPDELEPADAMAVYLGKEAGARKNYKHITDKARTWRGRLIHIITIQNQTYVDYRMVIRNMLAESIGYHKQWKQKKAAHEEAKDLVKGSDAFVSKMNKDEKFTPIITLVVYCGTDHGWDGARCLYDLLDIDDEMKEFVTNYKLNLYDCHEHDTFDEYHTGLRQLFEVTRYCQDKEQLKRVIEENREAYSNLDGETRELIEVTTGVKFTEEQKTMKDGKERYNMCKAFEDMRLEGKIEGKIEDILELLEELGQVPPRITEMISSQDSIDVLSRWFKSAVKAESIAEFEANM